MLCNYGSHIQLPANFFLENSFGSRIQPTSGHKTRKVKNRDSLYHWDGDLPLYVKRYTVNVHKTFKVDLYTSLSKILKTVEHCSKY
jgi:hypothetical protein